jgi:hypothetical protein
MRVIAAPAERRTMRASETFSLYGIGGSRVVSSDGYLIGTFTAQAGSFAFSSSRAPCLFVVWIEPVI